MPDDGYPDRPQQLWTQGQDEDSRFWFPCFDYPNERFTSEIVVTVPSEWTTISNGTLTSSEPSGSDGSRRSDHWVQNKPLPAYLNVPGGWGIHRNQGRRRGGCAHSLLFASGQGGRTPAVLSARRPR